MKGRVAAILFLIGIYQPATASSQHQMLPWVHCNSGPKAGLANCYISALETARDKSRQQPEHAAYRIFIEQVMRTSVFTRAPANTQTQFLFLLARAQDVLQEDSRKTVKRLCALAEKKNPSTNELMRARCLVGMLQTSLIEDKPNRSKQEIKSLVELFKITPSVQNKPAILSPEEGRSLLSIGLATFAATQVQWVTNAVSQTQTERRDTQRAIGYALELLRSSPGPIEPDSVMTVLEHHQAVLNVPEGIEIEPLVAANARLGSVLADSHFGQASDTARDVLAAGTRALARLSKNSTLSSDEKTALAVEAFGNVSRLISHARHVENTNERLKQLGEIEKTLVLLERNTEALDVLLEQQVISLGTKDNHVLRVDVAYRLARNPQTKEIGLRSIHSLIDEILRLPDETEGLAKALYDAAQTIAISGDSSAPCRYYADLQLQTDLLSRASRIALTKPLTSGMLTPPIDWALKALFQNVLSWEQKNPKGRDSAARMGCTPIDLKSASTIDVERRIAELELKLKSAKTAPNLSDIERLRHDIEAMSPRSKHEVDPTTDRLLAHLHQTARTVVKAHNLWSDGEWIDFIGRESHRLTLSGRPTQALALLDDALRNFLDLANTNQEALFELLSRYPRSLWREMRPETPDPKLVAALALSAALSGNDLRWGELVDLIKDNPDDHELSKLGDRLTIASHFDKASTIFSFIKNRATAERASELNSWNRTKHSSKVIAPASFHVWIEENSEQRDARANLIVDRSIAMGQHDTAVSIAQSIQKPPERSGSIRKLADAGLLDAAIEMIAYSRPQDRPRQRLSVAARTRNDSIKGKLFQAARKELEFIYDPTEWTDIATGLLEIAPTPEYQEAIDLLAAEILERINSKADQKSKDGSLFYLATRLSRLRSAPDLTYIIERIQDPVRQGSAWLRCAQSFSDQGQQDLANKFLERAVSIARASPDKISSFYDEEQLFLLTKKLQGGVAAERLADQLFTIDRTASLYNRLGQDRGRRNARMALALDAATAQNWSEAVDILIRQGLKDGEFSEAAEELLRNVKSDISEVAGPNILIERAILDLPAQEKVRRQSLGESFARLGLPDRAMDLIKTEENCNAQSHGYASIAIALNLRNSGDGEHVPKALRFAASAAEKCIARRERLVAFSELAIKAALLGFVSDAEKYSAIAENALLTPSVYDRRVDAAFKRLSEIDTSRLDRSLKTDYARAMLAFGESYQESGRPSLARQAWSLASSVGTQTRYKGDIERLGRQTRGEDPYAAEMRATVDRWKRRAASNPDEVMDEMRSSLYFSSFDDLDTLLDATRLRTTLTLQKAATEYRRDLLQASARSRHQLLADDIASYHLSVLRRWATSSPQRSRDAAAESFEIMLASHQSEAAVALTKALARQALSRTESSQAQEADVAAREWSDFREALIVALQQPLSPEKQDLKQLLASGVDARQRFEGGKDIALRRANSYLALTGGRDLSAGAISQSLAADEALLLYRVNARDVMVAVVTAEGINVFDLRHLTRTSLARLNDLTSRVLKSIGEGQTLLNLDMIRASPLSSRNLFDFNAANDLWTTLLAPIARVIQGKQHLLIVPDGPLTSLPFSVLSRNVPVGDQREVETFRSAEWLGRDYAITVLPTLARYITQSASGARAEKQFKGFGNPHGPPIDQIDCARVFAEAGATMGQDVATAFSTTSIGKPILADPAKLRALPPIPQTACQLMEIRDALGASLADIILGADASERKLKALSADGSLAAIRVIVFATHGFVSGEAGIGEPGLLLAPPLTATEEDDGFLAASEVLRLKFGADLVVLSACNTAAPSKPGAEPLSGLTSAFLFAGARSVLVSHWLVNSRAAMSITSQLAKETVPESDNANFARNAAKILQTTMKEMLAGAPTLAQAHPSYWGAFSLVAR